MLFHLLKLTVFFENWRQSNARAGYNPNVQNMYCINDCAKVRTQMTALYEPQCPKHVLH